MHWCLRRVLAASLLSLSLPGWSQGELSLDRALELAVAGSQQLVAADASALALSEMAVAAGQLPDPVLKLGVDNLPVTGGDRFSVTNDFMTMRRIGVMQEFTRGDKRRLRVERLEQDARRVRAERQQTEASIQRQTALAWIDRRYAQATSELIRQQLQESELQIQGAEVAFGTGRGSQADIFAARAGLATLRDKLRQSERQLQAAEIMLARWVGSQAGGMTVAGDVPWQRAPEALSVLQDLSMLPSLAVLAAQVSAAEAEVRLAQANLRPDLTVEAMYQRRGPAFSDMVSVGVSIPLPIAPANRQDREIAAKAATVSEMRARYQDARAAERAALQVMVNDWNTDRQGVAQLRADLLPAAKNRVEGALAEYRAANGNLAAVLAARSEELDARMQVLALETETGRLWAQLNFILPRESTAAKDLP